MDSLSPVEWATLIASAVEVVACGGYTYMVVCIGTSNLFKLRFYQFFIATAAAGIGNALIIVFMRCFNQVFYSGPQFGPLNNVLAYGSHFFNFAHITMKIYQVSNRFTAMSFPTKQDHIWTTWTTAIAVSTAYFIPIAAIYISLPGGRVTYGSIPANVQLFSKAISSLITAIFLIITVPMNIFLCLGMRNMTQSSGAKSRKERVYVLYTLVLTLSNLLKCVHQLIWMYATLTSNNNLNLLCIWSYAYPTAMTIYTPPIALLIMSKEVRHVCIRSIRPSNNSTTSRTSQQTAAVSRSNH